MRPLRQGSGQALGAAIAAAIALAPRAAAADLLAATLGEPMYEVSHAVAITIKDGVATYKVRRVFANPGKRADEAALEIDLPPGAAATGLRIRARDRWYDGELMEAEKAARLYHQLTGLGAYQPKDPALLQWIWADKLFLQVFPVLPGATSTVEYTLTVPTKYDGGRVFVSYPRLAPPPTTKDPAARGLALAPPVVTVHPSWGDATTRVSVDGARIAPDTPVVLTTPVPPDWLERVDRDAGASYAGSEIPVPAVAATKGPFTEVTVKVDIDHTFQSDLQVALLPPSGGAIPVFGGATAEGGGDGGGDGGKNDLKRAFTVKLPAPMAGAGTWRLVVSDHAARDAGSLAGWTLAFGKGRGAFTGTAHDTPVFVPDAPESANDAGLAAIVLAPPRIDTVSARLGKVVASDVHAFARLELDTAPELRPLPKRAQVVFVVDGSHSAGRDGIAAQLALVRGYVSHVPDAAIEIVMYRRRAERLFGRFVLATELDKQLAAARSRRALEPGNGSALDAGARAAVDALRALGTAKKFPRRIVITTDKLLRSTYTNALALGALELAPAGTIVHVVEPVLDGVDQVVLVRADTDDLAPLAKAHHGIFARVEGLPARSDKALADAVLGLVRPVRIDHFRITGVDLADVGGAPETLDEGRGLRAMVKLRRAPDRVVLGGAIWGDAFRREVAVDAAFSRATAAFVFSEDEHQDLSRAEMLKVAMMGRAVSPVTSYLATEPGVRPSTIGIDRSGRGGTGFGTSGFGAGGAGFGGGRSKPDLMALLGDAKRACLAAHKPAAVTLEVETTRDEVVDVIARAGGKEPIAACLVEAVWALRLDAATYSEERESFVLAFR